MTCSQGKERIKQKLTMSNRDIVINRKRLAINCCKYTQGVKENLGHNKLQTVSLIDLSKQKKESMNLKVSQ